MILTVALVAMGTVHGSELAPAKSPDAAVRSLFEHAKGRDFKGAYRYVSASSNIDEQAFARDLGGRDGSLRTYSNLQNVDTRILNQNDNVAMVRATVEWSTAIGAILRHTRPESCERRRRVEGGVADREAAKGPAAGDPGELSPLGHHHARQRR